MTYATTLVLSAAIGLVAALSPAQAMAASEQQRAAQAIERALQKHGGDVHACFAKVLAERLDSAGKVEVAVAVGKGGKVKSAKVQKVDKTAGPALAACIEKAALNWTLEGLEAGATVVLPFSFKAQGSQYVVNAADVGERGAPPPGKGKAGPSRAAPFTVKVLADEQNVKAQGIALTLLNVGPASRVAMQRHPHCAKVLYLVKGHARVLAPGGVPPLKIDEGDAVFVPAGYPHAIENMGRQATAVFLQAFSPPGPERVYRDPTDARGRAEFEVIRDPAAVKAPDGKVVSASAAEAKASALPMNAGVVKSLVAGGGMSFALLELNDGAELPSSGSASTTELLYFVSGGGTVKIGGQAFPLAAESVVHVPPGTPYLIKAAATDKADKNDKIVAAQLKVNVRPGPAAPNRAPQK